MYYTYIIQETENAVLFNTKFLQFSYIEICRR